MSKKRLFLAVVMAVLLLTPVGSKAEMYVGLYLGGNFAAESTPWWKAHYISPTKIAPLIEPRTFWAHGVQADPAFVIGGKIGYWFSREGFLSYNYSEWMKYFGFEIQVDYHDFSWGRQDVTISPINQRISIENDGYMVTLGFMFMGRYGFMPDPKVPFGRLQPYIRVGPGVFFTRTSLNIGRDFKSTEGDLGLIVETGLRYIIRKEISCIPLSDIALSRCIVTWMTKFSTSPLTLTFPCGPNTACLIS